MLLLIDAGNTRIKWVLAERRDSQWEYVCDVGHESHEKIDSKLVSLREAHPIERVLVSSVAGAAVKQSFVEVFGADVEFARVARRACGLDNDYQSLDTLGVDRWAAALGAATVDARCAEQSTTNLIVIDAGTAVTVDVIVASQVYLGGVILPGARLMRESLVGNTAGIQANQQNAISVVGKTTHECVNAGAKFGLAGAVQRVIGEIVLEIDTNDPWRIVLCGGDAPWLYKLLEVAAPVEQNKNLIFDGLLVLYDSGELGKRHV